MAMKHYQKLRKATGSGALARRRDLPLRAGEVSPRKSMAMNGGGDQRAANTAEIKKRIASYKSSGSGAAQLSRMEAATRAKKAKSAALAAEMGLDAMYGNNYRVHAAKPARGKKMGYGKPGKKMGYADKPMRKNGGY